MLFLDLNGNGELGASGLGIPAPAVQIGESPCPNSSHFRVSIRAARASPPGVS